MTEERYDGHKRWWMFPGRFEPFHDGHRAIAQTILDKGKNLWIAIRDTEISEKNPYNTHQRIEMIKRSYQNLYGERVIATVIPDIEGIVYGRGVGFQVEQVEVPKKIKEISATNIRAGKDNRLHERVANYINLLESTFLLTGLPCAGKTTIADRLKEELDNREGYKTFRLDGDVIRGVGKINEDLGFSDKDREENLRRMSHIARMFNDNKTTAIASFVSPTNYLRNIISDIIGKERFRLIYVSCPLEVCEQRDVKGMYAKARKGEIKDFTGISAPFEIPINPDVTVETGKTDIETCINKILEELDI